MGGRDKGNILLRRANFVGTKNCGGEKARAGWEAARPCVSKEAKPAKIDSLKEKGFCARPLKEKEIFAGFVRRQAASRWGVFLPVRAEMLAQKRFALRSVIATNLNIANFAGSWFARSQKHRGRRTPRIH